jgi:hypothetical protein
VDTQKVIDVTTMDVFGYKISRFKLQILGTEQSVSMSEEAPGVLVTGFNNNTPLSIAVDSNETPVLMKFVQYPSGAAASLSEVEMAFGASIDADEYWRIATQLQVVARTFIPELCIYGPERRENGSRALDIPVLSITQAPTLSAV